MNGLTFLLLCMLGAVALGAVPIVAGRLAEWWQVRHS